jgi:IS30 family transposase
LLPKQDREDFPGGVLKRSCPTIMTRGFSSTVRKPLGVDPSSPCQRGTNENTNGLLRQSFLHGADLSAVTQQTLNTVAKGMNAGPRKTLGCATPAATLYETVTSTG